MATIAPPPVLQQRVASLRAFSRLYTRIVGALREGLLETPYSLTEARVLFELAQRDGASAAELGRALELDAGYLSRILARFGEAGLVSRERSSADARRHVLRLAPAGREAFAQLDRRADEDALALLVRLAEPEQRRLVAALDEARRLLGERPAQATLVLRDPEPGDLGWIVERHGALYAAEHGWDAGFEALVARIVAEYAASRDARCERCWIAEVDGRRAGCVLCVRRDAVTAQLRLLLVEREARGLGLGGRLVDECLRFAERCGYDAIVLWTNDVLTAARRLYERAGFELVEQGPHRAFGHDLVEQTWRRGLR
jgi:DNA-binding MarR family transcriptional regulator/N-acetylglutamate synthase-like GNAT family acetyltransferase